MAMVCTRDASACRFGWARSSRPIATIFNWPVQTIFTDGSDVDVKRQKTARLSNLPSRASRAITIELAGPHKFSPMGQTWTYFKRKETEEITFEQLAEEIRKSKHCVALTGAGISAESGIPTFRDPGDGLWQKYDPKIYATIWGYRAYPEKIWELLRDFLRDTEPKPNRGHIALAEMEKLGYLKSITTQNVDNLHQDAGSTDVTEFHGNLMEAKCYKCSNPMSVSKEQMRDASFTSSLPPKCPKCGGNMKPTAVLFGEGIPSSAYGRAFSEAKKCDLLLVIGTSANVSPASDIPYTAMSNGAQVIEVNIEKTGLTNRISDKLVIGRAGELTRTVDKLR